MVSLSDLIRKEFEINATQKKQRADLRYLDSPLVVKYVKQITGKDSIYCIRDVEIAKKIYLSVQNDVVNINAHQNYSAAILHYCNFLSFKVKVTKKSK